jgi:hypothetical protein
MFNASSDLAASPQQKPLGKDTAHARHRGTRPPPSPTSPAAGGWA